MIEGNIIKVKERISCVCFKINREPTQIAIIAVSKGRTVEQIKEVIAAGITDIGENRVQEALLKYNELGTCELVNSRTIKWHMVGHLQTNKAKEAVKIFDSIQSVDSLRVAREIDKEAAKIGKIQDILIEIKTSPQETKFGLSADVAVGVIKEMDRLKNINIKGLMTVAPMADNPEKTRPYFRRLRELLEEINAMHIARGTLRILSMGMTDDFEVAIEEGSNMVRLGRVIFEA